MGRRRGDCKEKWGEERWSDEKLQKWKNKLKRKRGESEEKMRRKKGDGLWPKRGWINGGEEAADIIGKGGGGDGTLSARASEQIKMKIGRALCGFIKVDSWASPGYLTSWQPVDKQLTPVHNVYNCEASISSNFKHVISTIQNARNSIHVQRTDTY